jgi:hypothetical protein
MVFEVGQPVRFGIAQVYERLAHAQLCVPLPEAPGLFDRPSRASYAEAVGSDLG